MKQLLPVILAAFCAFSALANQTLINLPVDSWYTVPNTKMRPSCDPHSGSYGCAAVQSAWSGGAYDADQQKMMIWGGGHVDSDDNAVYAFSTQDWRWEQLTPNTGYLTPQSGVDPLPSGDPASRHTYNGLAYAGHIKRMWACQGSVAGNGNGTGVVWTFDAVQKKWYNMKATGTAAGSYFGYNGGCSYDPVSRKAFFSDPRYVYIYSFDSNAWTSVGWAKEDWGKKADVYDPKRRLIFFFGNRINVWDIQNNREITTGWSTSDSATLLNGNFTAFDYDAKADQIVAWNGGGPYELDMTTKQWVRKSGAGAPPAPLPNGTYGRWRYLPDDNVFVLVNGVDSNVCFYKHTAGGGTATEKRDASFAERPFAVSPNPFHSGAVIKLDAAFPGSKARLRVFTSEGRLVCSGDFTGAALRQGVRLPGKGLSSGVYLFCLDFGTEVLKARAFFLQ